MDRALIEKLTAHVVESVDRLRRHARPESFEKRPIALLLAVMAASALAAGLLGLALARAGTVVLLEPLASRVPADRHAVFLADLWAHSARYLVGFVGGIALIHGVWRSRRSLLDSRPEAEHRGSS